MRRFVTFLFVAVATAASASAWLYDGDDAGSVRGAGAVPVSAASPPLGMSSGGPTLGGPGGPAAGDPPAGSAPSR